MIAAISWRPVPVLHLGPLPIYPHGLLIAVGFLAGARLMQRYTRPAGISDDALWRVLTPAFAAGLVGMRVVWVLGHTAEIRSPIDLIAVWHGGMSLLGGLFVALPVGALAARREGLPPLPLLDMAAPGLALGIAIGRLSDLIVGDHLGKPTDLPWGFRYLGSDHPFAGAPPIGTVVHPVALYDLLLTSALLFVLLWFLRKPRSTGSAIALFAAWYAAGRVLTDFLRTDPRRAFGLTGSQLASVGVLAGVVVALWVRYRPGRDTPRTKRETSIESGAPGLTTSSQRADATVAPTGDAHVETTLHRRHR